MADDQDDDEKEEPGVRRACTLQPQTLERLRTLKKGKWYGGTVSKVMTNMIEIGLREARKEGYLTLDD